jgi:hypothetical protein
MEGIDNSMTAKKAAKASFDEAGAKKLAAKTIEINGEMIDVGDKAGYKQAIDQAYQTGEYNGYKVGTIQAQKLMMQHELQVAGTPEWKAKQLVAEKFPLSPKAKFTLIGKGMDAVKSEREATPAGLRN